MNDTTQTLIRSVLKIGAGYLLSKGFIDASHTEELCAALMSVIAIIWGVLHRTPAPQIPASSNVTPSASGRTLPLLFLLGALGAFVVTGCKTNANLEKGGAYAPATVTLSTNASGVVTTNTVATSPAMPELYIADVAYKLAYDTIQGAFAFERDNRKQLAALSPSIKIALDKIRPIAWEIDQRWNAARRDYRAFPSASGFTTLQGILGEIQRLVPVVQDAIAPAYTLTAQTSTNATLK